MINVAVIGAGSISGFHIEGYLAFGDRCRIVAVADIDKAKAERQIARYGLDAVAASDVGEVLAGPGIDLASVCTPPGTHAEITELLLSAGVHTLCEKPMAPSLVECDAMIAAAERSGAILSSVAQNRFTTPMMRLKQVLDSGQAGRLLHARVDSHWWRGHSYYDLWWRGTWDSEGGGCTLNHAVHHIDALRWMAGPPAEVQAIMANVAHDNAEVEDLSLAIVRFGSGALGQITSSVVHHAQDQRIVFQTDRAEIAMPWTVRASAAKPNGFPEPDKETERSLDRLYESLPEVPRPGHTGQIDDVLTAIESRGTGTQGTGTRGTGTRGVRVLVDGREGRGAVELITAIYKSAITGGRVTLPLEDGDPFRTKDGLLAAAPHFYEKTASVAGFDSDEITTTGGR